MLNVGRGEAVHTRHLVENLAAIAGFKGRIIESDDGSSRSSAVPWQRADISTYVRRGSTGRHVTASTHPYKTSGPVSAKEFPHENQIVQPSEPHVGRYRPDDLGTRRRRQCAAQPSRQAVPDIAQKVAVPAYINPLLDPNAWAQLATSSPAAMGFAVANVINGPDYTPLDEWSQVIQSVSASGVKVVGYVDTGYLGTTGQRTRLGSTDPVDWMSQIQHDVDTWYRFYGSSLSGIFFDQTQNACGPTQGSNAWADLYKRLSDNVERLYPGSVTVLNPGIAVPQCYETAGDVIVTFEGSYASYVGDPSAANPYTPLSWTPVDPMKIWHIVYDAPDVTTMANTIALSETRNAGYIYVTDDVLANPYDTLPPLDYWAAELATVLTLPDVGKLPNPPASLDTVEDWATSVALDWVGSRRTPAGGV